MPHQVTDPPPAATRAPGDREAAEPAGVRRRFTPAMMADVLEVPPAAIRHWIRSGLLEVTDRAGSLDWLDYGQLVIGRQLAQLLGSGLSLREIDSKLAGLAAGDGQRAAAAIDRIVLDGRRMSIVRGGRLLGPGGQLQFSFYTESLGAPRAGADREGPAVVELAGRTGDGAGTGSLPGDDVVGEILDLADDLEAAGEFAEAAEALRAVLQAQGPTAAVTFTLAELLYRAGDLTAARERFYMAIELDPDHLRARTSLGCVLAELGEPELAAAALEGVLRQEPDDAEAHWHMAGVLAATGRRREARRHLEQFLELAPDSPWAGLARDRLAADE